MPRGQYDRSKLRQPVEAPAPSVHAVGEQVNSGVLTPTQFEQLHNLGSAEDAVAALSRPKRDTFEAWADEGDAVRPNHDRIGTMIGQWAGAFMQGGAFTYVWLPANDGRDLNVTLETPHGSTSLTAPAGDWTDRDIEAALQTMREELRV